MSDGTPHIAAGSDLVTDSAAHPSMLLFGVTKLSDMLEKGNVWYLRLYESYFRRVDALYLLGKSFAPMQRGGTTLLSTGSGKSLIDLLLAPITVYRQVKRLSPDVCVTADQVFSWWTGLLIRLLARQRVVLMPVAVPEELYRDYGSTMSGLPIWLERIMLRLSYASAYRVLTAHAAGGYVNIFRDYRLSRNKLLVVKSFGEALPPPSFVEALQKLPKHDPVRLSDPMRLIYVGRLNREKLVEDLIRMMRRLADMAPERRFCLRLLGDGPDRARLEALAAELQVEAMVEFAGAVDNAEIPAQLEAADAFMSPLTGMSLREAALSALPVVAYERDWVVGMLKHDDNALLVASRDVEGLAHQVLRLSNDTALRQKLSRQIHALAQELWSMDGLRSSLAEMHAAVLEGR